MYFYLTLRSIVRNPPPTATTDDDLSSRIRIVTGRDANQPHTHAISHSLIRLIRTHQQKYHAVCVRSGAVRCARAVLFSVAYVAAEFAVLSVQSNSMYVLGASNCRTFFRKGVLLTRMDVGFCVVYDTHTNMHVLCAMPQRNEERDTQNLPLAIVVQTHE